MFEKSVEINIPQHAHYQPHAHKCDAENRVSQHQEMYALGGEMNSNDNMKLTPSNTKEKCWLGEEAGMVDYT